MPTLATLRRLLTVLLLAVILSGGAFAPAAVAAGPAGSPVDVLLAQPTGSAPIAPERARATIAQAKALAASHPDRKLEIDAYVIPYERALEPGGRPAAPPLKPLLILKNLTGGIEIAKARSTSMGDGVINGILPDGSAAVWQKDLYLGYLPWYTDQELDSPAGAAPTDLTALAAEYDAEAAAYPDVGINLKLEAGRLRTAGAKLKDRANRRTQDLRARHERLSAQPYDPGTDYTREGLAKMLLDAEALRHDDNAPEAQAKLDAQIAPFRRHFEHLLAGEKYLDGRWHSRQELDDTRHRQDFEQSLDAAVDALAAPAASLTPMLAVAALTTGVFIILGWVCLRGKKRPTAVRLCGVVFCAAPVVAGCYVWSAAQSAGRLPATGSDADAAKVTQLLYFASNHSGQLPPDKRAAQLSESDANASLKAHLHFVNKGGPPSALDVRRTNWQVQMTPGGLTFHEWDQWVGGNYTVQYDLTPDESGRLDCRAVRIGNLTAPAALGTLLWGNLSARLRELPQAHALLALYPYREFAPGETRFAVAAPATNNAGSAVAAVDHPAPAPDSPTPMPDTPAPAAVAEATPGTPHDEESVVAPAHPLTDAEMHDARGYSTTFSDTWAATDGLGRAVADARKAGPPQPGKRFVGIFYFLWHKNIPKIFDVTKLLAANPLNPQWGPTPQHHWWGEPYYGYYQADDPWVIRKHAQMLSDAGVDVIVFDSTNGHTFKETITQLCEVYTQMRKEGCQTPQIAFMLNARTGPTAQGLYDELYGPNRFPELWFRWQGKPVLLAQPEEVPEKISDFFTIKRSWAWTGSKGWFGDGKDKWPWLDNYPQNYGWSEDRNVPEELSMCVAQHPTGNYGRSHVNGKEPPESQQDPSKGIAFAEEFKQVMKVKPEFLFITGWNEWHASRFLKGPKSPASQFMGKPLKMGDSYWVDEFSQEFSRDIEPQRGHFEDNYYYQMVSYIRQYKGVRPLPNPSPSKIINGFDDWKDVGPEYLDDVGDTAPRNFPGCGEVGAYTNNEGRNDIVRAKVARSMSTVWFYVETRKNLTSPDGRNWMQLLINSDSNAQTGWFGYDYVINRQPCNGNNAVLERYDNERRAWVAAARVPIRIEANRLYVGIPRSAVKEFSGPLKFEFKGADNVPLDDLKSPAGFMDHGDVAPNARFNYVFAERE